MKSRNLMSTHSMLPCFQTGMNRVLPGLYIGSFADSKDKQQLKSKRITHILSLRSKPGHILAHSYYLHLPVSDTSEENIARFFPVCNNFIHKARLDNPLHNNVLVHCYAGVSRSATIVVAYLMTVASLSWQQALQVVYNVRHVVQPNIKFLFQLQRFQAFGLHRERRRLHRKFPTRTLMAWDHWRVLAILGYNYENTEKCDCQSSESDEFYECCDGN